MKKVYFTKAISKVVALKMYEVLSKELNQGMVYILSRLRQN